MKFIRLFLPCALSWSAFAQTKVTVLKAARLFDGLSPGFIDAPTHLSFIYNADYNKGRLNTLEPAERTASGYISRRRTAWRAK